MFFRIAALLAIVAHGAALAAEPRLDFNRDIRPILSDNCFHCHGADAAQRQAELRLDVRDAAVELGAIAPGSAEDSTLVERITSDDPDVKMPPPDSKRQLTADQIDKLSRWIAEGAEYKGHWAFIPVERPEPPAVKDQTWPRNAIDQFVLSKLEQSGLAPSARAPLPVLFRRISFDLIGLPPNPAQLTAWQEADDPVAAAVDELLASPHFGERMAVDWLDVARYADTHGFNNDTLRTMWRWRDWVVDAFNENMPYSRFITVQLAGDLLPDATLEDRIATGFNRNHVINSEGGIIDEEYRVEYVADRVRTMSLAWLGLTLECARCHDHKFDPLPQREYYQVFAFFNSVDETGEDGRVDNAAPLMRAPTRAQDQQYQEMLANEHALEEQLQRMMRGAPPEDSEENAATPSTAGAAWDALEKQNKFKLAEDPQHFPAPKPVRPEATAFELGGGWAWFAWVKRESASAAPLLSTMSFSAPPSAQGYGGGIQAGFSADGAVDVRVAARWPAYALNVVSVDKVPVGQWSHVAVTGQGKKAEGVRIFIDGVEVETDVRHDDLTASVSVDGAVQIAQSGEPANNQFEGFLHRARLLSGTLDEKQLDAVLEAEVLGRAASTLVEEFTWGQELVRTNAQRAAADPTWVKLLAEWRAARKERLAFLRSFPTLMVIRDVAKPREAFILERGQYDKPGEKVEPDVPQALGLPLPADAPRDRIALAKWLTDSRHPLTSRVVVNRFWHSFFGVGLVKTVEDLGTQSEWPSHPDLLDWLAAEFIASDWDVKHMVRLIVESATYQQDSSAPAELWARDPENRLLARGPRQRLTAEMIRDQALSASGLLAPRLGGPPVSPYQPAGLYENMIPQADYPGTVYQQSKGEDLYRRSLYTFWKRTVPYPTLSTFDAPDREFCTARRSVTTTPLQALVLMNDPTFLEAARRLGGRMLTEGGASDEARLAWAFELLTARKPEADELVQVLRLLNEQRAEFALPDAAPKGLLTAGESPQADLQPAAELAAYASIASLLLNLDEALTRN